MPNPRLWLLNILLVIALLLPVSAAAAPIPDETLVRIALADAADASTLFAGAPLAVLAVEAAPQPYALARADEAARAWLRARGLAFTTLDQNAAGAHYLLVDLAAPPHPHKLAGIELYNDGVRALRRLPAGQALDDYGFTATLLDTPWQFTSRPAARLPQVVTPLPAVQEIIDQVNLTRTLTYVNELSGETPATINGQPYTIATRNTYSGVPLQQAVAYMQERLTRLGLAVTTHRWNVSYPANLIAEKPGLDPDAGIVILCAHLDSTSETAATVAPGADDNGSGAVAVLQAAEILAAYNFDATLRFILFTGEEQGLLGSRAYAQMVQAQDIRGVLNMDMIAWDASGGPDMDIHAKSAVPGNMDLGNLYADVINAYNFPLTPVVYASGTTASDHSPFWTYNIPAILAIENYYIDASAPRDFNAYYHTTSDRVQHYNTGYFTAMLRASTATFAHMGGLRTDCYWADLDCSGAVTAADITKLAGAWLARRGQWNYSLVYDVNDDGMVNVLDIQTLAVQWGWVENQAGK